MVHYSLFMCSYKLNNFMSGKILLIYSNILTNIYIYFESYIFLYKGSWHIVCDKLLDAHIPGRHSSYRDCLLRHSTLLRGLLPAAEEIGVGIKVADILSLRREHHWSTNHQSVRRHAKVAWKRIKTSCLQ